MASPRPVLLLHRRPTALGAFSARPSFGGSAACRQALEHNKRVEETGEGEKVEVRETDLSVKTARQRYRLFMDGTMAANEALKQTFPFNLINAAGVRKCSCLLPAALACALPHHSCAMSHTVAVHLNGHCKRRALPSATFVLRAGQRSLGKLGK
eukprot:scaffold23234_cov28-Tisochrysis_lutea.AAC.4